MNNVAHITKKRVTPLWVKGVMCIWAVSVLCITAFTMAKHSYARPIPQDLQALHQTLQGFGDDVLLHVLDARCTCTKSLTNAMLKRTPLPFERVVFIGDDDEVVSALRSKYRVHTWTAGQLAAQTGIEVAPIAVSMKAGTLVYIGGYYQTPSPIRPQLTSLQQTIVAGEAMAALPVFGCSTDVDALL